MQTATPYTVSPAKPASILIPEIRCAHPYAAKAALDLLQALERTPGIEICNTAVYLQTSPRNWWERLLAWGLAAEQYVRADGAAPARPHGFAIDLRGLL